MEQLLKWEKKLHQVDVQELRAKLEEKDQEYQTELKEREKLQRENDQLYQAEVQEREQLLVLKKEEKLRTADIQQLHEQLKEKDQLYQQSLQLQSRHSNQLCGVEAQLQAKEAQLQAKDTELSSQSTLLSQNRTTIVRLTSQLQLAKDFLVKGNQVHFLSPNARLRWKECPPMPLKMAWAQATVISGHVYVGGGDMESDGNCYLVCKYDPVKNEWNTLPPTPVKLCGIGQLNGKLVLVGGILQSEKKTANIHVFEDSQQWEKSIPAMPSACSSPAVLSHNNSLVVCGGKGDGKEYCTVFMYNGHTSQWLSTKSQIFPFWRQSNVVMGNHCFLAMGYDAPIINQQKKSVISTILPSCSVVQNLPDMPHYDSSIATIGGSVLAIGGVPKVAPMIVSHLFSVVTPFRRSETVYRESSSSQVYAYCPSTSSWIHISDPPAPRYRVTTATLPSGELLVMGGGNRESDFSNSVFMGSIKIIA